MKKKSINLALQGGGAHGAFTWGVLDRLLEQDDLEIASISGTSAGALNGAAVKAGLVRGDRKAAKENLAWLWKQIGAVEASLLKPWMFGGVSDPGAVSKMLEYSPFFAAADAASRLVSPYAYGALYKNPLRRIVERFHYDAVCGDAGPRFFVTATNVRTGKIRVFEGADIHADVILASGCLPTLFQAPEFRDPKTGNVEAFWDGGYTGNPALFPMFARDLPDDIVVVNINPLERLDLPTTPQEIQNRINEISFNSSLFRELRAIQFVKDLIAEGALAKGVKKDVLVHMIADDALMRELSVATKMVPVPQVLTALHKAGRRAAAGFLDDHWDKLGKQGSVDLREMFG
ncbi:Ferredoxin reductase [Candidatus Rhodobacter oscarellae]|uniref:Ferredoxin reductase n=1 Tax=Candidatus Rhodobacter oscarellae TaxID=1675527 RepID=A0A0J9GUG6_9RHOB|nr:patatin-like phospholipase family protein [Candidatus Rhodobacter lobularis]KMW57228.1 Ferredoxin reductase [Candidatus Rhodobacter lobularis]